MTRKDHLVQLVAGLGSWTPDEGKVAHAVALLAEIERVCPEEPRKLKDINVIELAAERRKAINDAVDHAVAVERERCAKIIETLDPFGGGLGGHTAAWAVQQGAAAIRRGGV